MSFDDLVSRAKDEKRARQANADREAARDDVERAERLRRDAEADQVAEQLSLLATRVRLGLRRGGVPPTGRVLPPERHGEYVRMLGGVLRRRRAADFLDQYAVEAWDMGTRIGHFGARHVPADRIAGPGTISFYSELYLGADDRVYLLRDVRLTGDAVVGQLPYQVSVYVPPDDLGLVHQGLARLVARHELW